VLRNSVADEVTEAEKELNLWLGVEIVDGHQSSLAPSGSLGSWINPLRRLAAGLAISVMRCYAKWLALAGRWPFFCRSRARATSS
jgi:hypothetical protein